MDALASELYYIAIEADRAGRTAVIDDRSVAIFTSTRTPRAEEPSYVSFRVDRVQSIVEARAVLQTISCPAQGVATSRERVGDAGSIPVGRRSSTSIRCQAARK